MARTRTRTVCWTLAAAGAALVALAPRPGHAVPVLQLYVEGATYNTTHESWVFDGVSGDPIRLWVIGNVAGHGNKGAISNVRLSVVYPDPVPGDGGAAVSVSLTPSTIGGFGGVTDPSTPVAAVFRKVNETGKRPRIYRHKRLPSHGVYGPGFEWQEFALGNFTKTDSPIADFIYEFPTSFDANAGQINVYDLLITGPITDVHFDTYGRIDAGRYGGHYGDGDHHGHGGRHGDDHGDDHHGDDHHGRRYKAVFAPLSHDAGTGINEKVPEPSSLALLAVGMLMMGSTLWRRRRPV